MSIKWYYLHDGATRGPFFEEEIKDHATRKLLLATDLLWREGEERKNAAPASAIFHFTPWSATSSPLPDWLADIAQAESKGPLPEPLPSNDIPEWLEDLRLWVGLELYSPATSITDRALLKPGQAGNIPDWLQCWLTPEKRTVSLTPPTIPIGAAAPPLSLPPAIRPSPAEPSRPKTANPMVEKMIQSSGVDLETGQIFDPAKFQKWKQQQAQSPTVSNVSLLEVFRKARIAIETCVDDDLNRACILQTDIEEIKQWPAIQAILCEYANYGQTMQEKLLRHLEFMVENRKKYYGAVATRPN